MLGDPAALLLMPRYSEFVIEPADYKFANSFPSIRETIKLTIYPRNLGIFADSLKVSFRILKNGNPFRTKDTILYNFGLIDTLNFNFVLDSAGNYSVKVQLDPDNWNTQEIKTNNIIIIPVLLKNISFIPLKPIDNQVITSDSVEIVGINPNVDFRSNSVKLILQIDSSKNFNSSLSRSYFVNNPTGLVTKFKVAFPVKDSGIVYFCRLNAVINTDSSGWSENRRFIYGSNNANFIKSDKSEIDQIVNVYKKYVNQYNSTDLFNAAVKNDSITISKYNGNIVAQSFGSDIFCYYIFIFEWCRVQVD